MLIPNIIAAAAVAATFVSGLPSVTDANYAVLAAREAVPDWSTQAHTVSKRGFGFGSKSKRPSSPPRGSNPKPDDFTRRPISSPPRQRPAPPSGPRPGEYGNPLPYGAKPSWGKRDVADEPLEKRVLSGGFRKLFGKKKKPSSPPAAKNEPEPPAYPEAPPPRADGNPFPAYSSRPHRVQVPPKPYEPNWAAMSPPRPGTVGGGPLPYGAKPSYGKRDVADEPLVKRQGRFSLLKNGPTYRGAHAPVVGAPGVPPRVHILDVMEKSRVNPGAFRKPSPPSPKKTTQKTTQKRDVADEPLEKRQGRFNMLKNGPGFRGAHAPAVGAPGVPSRIHITDMMKHAQANPGAFRKPLPSSPKSPKKTTQKRDVEDESLEKRQGRFNMLKNGPGFRGPHAPAVGANGVPSRIHITDMIKHSQANPGAFRKPLPSSPKSPKKTTQKRDVEDTDDSDYESDQEDYEEELESDDEDNVTV
ncbi:hypothetical protein HYFRA_00003242 [Hymenoscyphus fraxineus]|uniref:Uncharacterized protein n=1 Tax=Hymenoscyphus fraxineus TaxID=746836 RepID=A0A9N9PS56_9HELO|nr:hypothetical protein HYFRA_00003242 [Hymenoscyphus fraxineus]